jgi:opacity protein-like surface antigen
MIEKLLTALAIGVVSVSCAAQVVPQANRPPLATSFGAGMDYWSGDWGSADINRFGPAAWTTITIWHDLSAIAEGHSMIVGGNRFAPEYKYFAGGIGLVYTSDYWGRFQPLFKGEVGLGSLTHPDNLTGHFHDSHRIWTVGGGVEYHTKGQFWTRVEYTYDFFPDFHSSVTGQTHSLNPRGFTIGETYRFGPSGSRF